MAATHPAAHPLMGEPREGRRRSSRDRRSWALNLTICICALAAIAALIPLWAPLVLAAWSATLAMPLTRRIAPLVRARKGAAAVLTVLLVLAFLVPFGLVLLSLSSSAVELAQRLQHSKTGADALAALHSSGSGVSLSAPNPRALLELVQRHAASALSATRMLFGAASAVIIGLVVFLGAFYTFLVNGAALHEWLLERSPLSRAHTERFAAAFNETGRGMLVGVGLTALLQGSVATIGYVVTGVPQALVLGFVTVFASLIPSVGAALIWVPVTAGLALSGHTGPAIVMLVIGLFVSIVDNLIRPLLSRYGKLELPAFALFVAMLGGIAAFGTWGLLLGPLFMRLATEGLSLWREERSTLLN